MSALLIEASTFMTQKRRLARQIISLTADFLLEIEAMKRDRYRTPENVSYLAHAEAHLCDLKIIAEAMMVVEYGSHLLTWLYTLRQFTSLILDLDILLAQYDDKPINNSPGERGEQREQRDSEYLRAIAEMKSDLSESIELMQVFVENAMRYCREQVLRREAAERICPCC